MGATAVVGLQFGDEGKGKIVDWLASDYKCVVRFNGGANAGHTVQNGRGIFKLHLIPAGIFNPDVWCFLGNGMVVDPALLLKELDDLEARGVSTAKLFISSRAHLVMPWHKIADELAEAGRGAIGTTKRGIGPCYADKALRLGIRVGDLLDHGLLPHLERLIDRKRRELAAFAADPSALPDAEHLSMLLNDYGSVLSDRIADTDQMVRDLWKIGHPILLEGAQAIMLDIDFGAYPYVSSSSPTAAGACVGSGLPPSAIDRVVGAAKAYTTRVGQGPMPTEINGLDGEHLRQYGSEFGTTTGRPRRCGWFDLPVVRHAVAVNGVTEIVLTKLDVLSGFELLKIATSYEYRGERYDLPPSPPVPYDEFKPEYVMMDGWREPIADIKSWRALPAAAKKYVEKIEQLIGVRISAVSTGAHRDSIIKL